MKISVSATAPSLDAEVDPRFGRCQYFIIIDPQSMEFETLDNSNAMAAGGAGISTAQMIASKGVEVVLTGNCGPNAYQTLSAAGIQVITGVSGRIRDAVEAYNTGKLQSSTQPSVGSHYGMGMGVTANYEIFGRVQPMHLLPAHFLIKGVTAFPNRFHSALEENIISKGFNING